MKQCPKCKKKFSDSDQFCNVDGSALMSGAADTKSHKNLLIGGLIVLAVVVTVGFNAFPYVMKWAASNCKVSLVGFKIEDSDKRENILKTAKELLDAFLGGSDKIPEIKSKDITLILSVDNRNIIPFTINSMDIELFVNSKEVAKGRLPETQKVKIGARKKKEIRLPLDISFVSLSSVIGSILMSDEIRYRAKGEVVLDTFISRINYPVDVEGIDLPVL